MSGLALIWNAEAQAAELVVTDAQQPDAALASAVLISLFSDRRAALDDTLPDAGGDRRGWWADIVPPVEGDLIGSRLWLETRGKRRAEDVRRVKDHAAEALAWMLTDGLASSIEIAAEPVGSGGIALGVVINRPSGPARSRFDFLWELH